MEIADGVVPEENWRKESKLNATRVTACLEMNGELKDEVALRCLFKQIFA